MSAIVAPSEPAFELPPLPGAPERPSARQLPTSRAERRMLLHQLGQTRRRRRQVWRAWWFWPLVVLAAGCVWLALDSASVPAPDRPQVVPSTSDAAP